MCHVLFCFPLQMANQKPISTATSSKKQECMKEEEEEAVKEDEPKKAIKEKLKEGVEIAEVQEL